MRQRALFPVLLTIVVIISACSQAGAEKKKEEESFILVEGGSITSKKSNYYGESVTLSNFYIGRYEVTQQEWTEIMGGNPSAFQGDRLPVEMVSWYDVIEYCNQRSMKEGLTPYYIIDKNQQDPNNKSEYDPIKWTVTIQEGANGYRLPTEAEWEYAAAGGQKSKGYTYSGGDKADDVAWYWRNAGKEYLTGNWSWPAIETNRNHTKPVGSKTPNELGLYDMSGNVREWCWNWYDEGGAADSSSGSFRIVKGGGWIGDVSNNEISFRGKFEASGFGPDQGFRLVRNE